MKQPLKKNVRKPLVDDSILNYYKLNFSLGFLIILLSMFIYGIVAMLLHQFYHPDLAPAHEFAEKFLLPANVMSCQPEPQEQLFYMAGILTITISIVLLYLFLKKLKKTWDEKSIHYFYIGSLVFGLIPLATFLVLMMLAANPAFVRPEGTMDFTCKTNWEFFFKDTFLFNNLVLYSLVIFPCTLVLFFFPFKLQPKTLHLLNVTNKTLVYGFCALIGILVFLISAFRFPYTYENKYDFNAVFYSTVQVYQGFPLLTNNFMNTYGLYPHFVVPVMKLFGGSVLSFTSIMALLLTTCFGFIFYVLRQTVRNINLVLFGFCSVFFISYMYERIITPYDSIFSTYPIRWILTFGLLFFGSVYLKHKTKWLYHLSFFIFSLGFLWNPDFGMLCYASLLAFYIYLELGSSSIYEFIKRSALHVVFAVVSTGLTIGVYLFTIRLFYGVYPDFKMLFSTIKVFSMIGFNMLPITLHPNPWMMVAFIYVVGLAYAAWHFIEKKINDQSSMVFLITMVGITSFTYMIGRSHNWNLIFICPYAFMLLTIFADEMLKMIKQYRIFYIPFALVTFILAISFFQTLYANKAITELVYEDQNKANNLAENQAILRNSEFIRENTRERERILLMTPVWHQGLYFNLSKTSSAINPGMGELFLKTDNERILNTIRNNRQTKVFFDPAGFAPPDVLYYTYLSSFYQVTKSQGPGGSLVMLTPRAVNTASKFILKQDQQSVFHELFDNDHDKRLAYAMGQKGKITLSDRFTGEIIFKPENMLPGKVTNAQTLIFNSHDSAGFCVQQNDTSTRDYLICLGKRCMRAPVVPGKWNYLAFEVDKNIITAWSNGNAIGKAAMPTPYVNSPENLFIGNIRNNGGFFFGEIKEVKISNSPLMPGDVQAVWKSIVNNVDSPQL